MSRVVSRPRSVHGHIGGSVGGGRSREEEERSGGGSALTNIEPN